MNTPIYSVPYIQELALGFFVMGKFPLYKHFITSGFLTTWGLVGPLPVFGRMSCTMHVHTRTHTHIKTSGLGIFKNTVKWGLSQARASLKENLQIEAAWFKSLTRLVQIYVTLSHFKKPSGKGGPAPLPNLNHWATHWILIRHDRLRSKTKKYLGLIFKSNSIRDRNWIQCVQIWAWPLFEKSPMHP